MVPSVKMLPWRKALPRWGLGLTRVREVSDSDRERENDRRSVRGEGDVSFGEEREMKIGLTRRLF